MRRHHIAGACVLASLLACMPACKRAPEPGSAAAVADDIDRINEENAKENLRQLDENGYIETNTSQAIELADRLREASAESSPSEALLYDAGAEFAESMAAITDEYGEYSQPFIESGGFDPTTLTSLDLFASRAAMVRELAAANETFTTKFNRLITEFPKKLRALESQGVSKAEIRDAIAGFQSSTPTFALVRGVRQTDADLCQHGTVYLEILQGTFGSWELLEDGTLLFDDSVDDATIERFNTAADGIQQAANEQAVLQRQLFSSP